MNLEEIGKSAAAALPYVTKLTAEEKNRVLLFIADWLLENTQKLILENKKDMENGRANGMKEGLLDRLLLTEERVQGIAEGIRKVTELADPVGEELSRTVRPNGLVICERRVPLGVIGMIYEARPNVTADAFSLCFKTGNVVILKGGRDALYSNMAMTDCIREALEEKGICRDAVQLITDNSRENTTEFMRLKKYVDVLIPRGGAGLIRSVIENSTVPVIETGTGNCHIYVDESADIQMALEIILNAKTQRIGVCNACESLVVHENIKDRLLPELSKAFLEKQVEVHADAPALALMEGAIPATQEDWGKEYLDYMISVKTVADVSEAIAHINRYNTRHSEAIITENQENAEKFLNEVDAAAVYVNASTRFTDGFEFGFGAEIGISTQKLHARGPMGLKALTTTKFVIYGNGQTRK